MKGLEVKAGFWSLFDQGAVSLGNILTQMILARNLSRSDYGVFALLYGVLFFLVSSVGSVVTYPLSVKGASTDSEGLRRLVGASLWFDFGLVVPGALIVLGATSALHHLDLFVFALAALAFWQFQETLRRALMSQLGHRDATWGDGLSYLGQAAVVFALARWGSLTLSSAFIAIAATSAVAAVMQFVQVKPKSREAAYLCTLAREYWHLGGWASATSLTNGLTAQFFLWALGLLFGTGEAGSLQAIGNPIKFFNPVLMGAQNLVIPATARTEREQGTRAASRMGLAYATIGALLYLPCLVFLLVWPHGMLSLLYGAHSPYVRLGSALRIFALAYWFGCWAEILVPVLNGMGLPRRGYLAQGVATLATVVIGLPLTAAAGLTGALVGIGACALAKAATALCCILLCANREGSETVAARAAL